MPTLAASTPSPFLRHNPLVLAAAIFLGGVTLGAYWQAPLLPILLAAATFLLLWFFAELAFTGTPQTIITNITLAAAILFAGAALWQSNQQSVEPTHIARFASDAAPVPVTARLRIITAPEQSTTHGNLFFLASVTEIYTTRGWLPSAGDVRVKWRSGHNPQLSPGEIVQAYAWLARPAPALNPGAFDSRQLLAADRIFAELRIPRANGLVPLTPATPTLTHPLDSLRLFLKSKLLAHTTKIDVEAGYSMLALLLGRRDPIIEPVAQSFAAAGVSHLIAISGAHLILFTLFVTALLSLIPLRPRLREFAIVLIVLAYVLATPCGPPVIRAAACIFLFLLSRLLGRPRMFLNTLATAAIVIILYRPADLFDAGFQLTFACTASLILFFPRFQNRLFHPWFIRQRMIADLAGKRRSPLKLYLAEILLGFATANFIGSITAAPLVAYHFGFLNPYAILSGLIAFPIIALTMAASALQLLLELISASLASLAAPLTTTLAHFMIWIVTHLAAIPGAALPLRAPPPYLIALFYAILLLLALRRHFRLTRALLLNATLALLTLTAAWYTFTQPLNDLQLTALSVSQGSSILLRLPSGQTWLLNAGSRDASNLPDHALAPALRLAGIKNLDALLITSLDTATAQFAPDVITRFHPPQVFLSTLDAQHPGYTRTGAELISAITATHSRQLTLAAGQLLNLGNGAQLRILSPTSDPNSRPDLVLLLEYAHRRILLLDPANPLPFGQLQFSNAPLPLDAIILLAPQRSPTTDAPLQKLLRAAHPPFILWSGRTAYSPKQNTPPEYNTADHSYTLHVTSDGAISLLQ